MLELNHQVVSLLFQNESTTILNLTHHIVQSQLLQVDESTRLGSQGIDSIKAHPWFNGIDWKGLADRTAPVPQDIISRINLYLESHSDDIVTSSYSPLQDLEELNTPEWLEDW